MQRNNKAFTLVELSVVLIIISIITGNLLSIYTDRSEADKIKKTEIILGKIEDAIANYFSEYTSIPCPADPSVSINSSNFGIASRNPYAIGYCGYNFTESWYKNLYNNGTKFIVKSGGDHQSYNLNPFGSVPTKELNIPDEFAFDAWGRRITYYMVEKCSASKNQYLTTSSDPNPNYNSIINFSNRDDCGKADQSIYIISKDLVFTSVNAIYVLLSHGKNAHGAYPHNGGTIRIKAVNVNDKAEEINAQMTSIGLYQTNGGQFVQKSLNLQPSDYFDDIVRYKNKDQLIKKSRSMIADSSYQKIDITNYYSYHYPSDNPPYLDLPQPFSLYYCNLALNAINANNYCSSLSDPNCTNYLNQIANQISQICL